jgi:type VI secretion system protein ImpA
LDGLSNLLVPIPGIEPSGPDLEYDPAFHALEQAARGKAERQFGSAVIPAEPPDWKVVCERAEGLLDRTKDLRVAVPLCCSWGARRGIAGLADGYGLVRMLLERFWDDLHPRLDTDDDDDPTMRVGALSMLVDPEFGLRTLRIAGWLASRGVECDVRRALQVVGLETPPVDLEAMSSNELEGLIRDVAATDPTNHARVAHDHVKAMSAFLDERIGSDRTPVFRPLLQILAALADTFDRVTGGGSTTETPGRPHDASTVASSPLPATARAGVPQTIGSRADASRALDAVCAYLERHEPANPAPLLIRRAQRLMAMGFLDIMRDIAPDALSTVEHIAGIPRNTE